MFLGPEPDPFYLFIFVHHRPPSTFSYTFRHTQSHAVTGHGNPFHLPPTVVRRVIIHRLYTYYVIIIYIFHDTCTAGHHLCASVFPRRFYIVVRYNIIIIVLFLFIFSYSSTDQLQIIRHTAIQRTEYLSQRLLLCYPCIILYYYDIRARTQICAKIRSLQLIFIAPQLSPTRLTDSSLQIDYTTEDSPTILWKKKMKKTLLLDHYKTI